MEKVRPRKTGILLVILLAAVLLALLVFTFKLNQQSQSIQDSAVTIAKSKPDFGQVDLLTGSIQSLQVHLSEYIDTRASSSREAYIAQLNTVEEKLNDYVRYLGKDTIAEDVSQSVIALQTLKEDLTRSVKNSHQKLKSFVDTLSTTDPLPDITADRYLSRMSRAGLLDAFKNDSLIVKSLEDREAWFGKSSVKDDMHESKSQKRAEEEAPDHLMDMIDQGSDGDRTTASMPDEDSAMDSVIVIEPGSQAYFVLEYALDKILSRTEQFYSGELQRIIEDRNKEKDAIGFLMREHSNIEADLNDIIARARSIETLDNELHLDRQLAYMESGLSSISQFNKINAALIILIIIIMAWFLKRNFEYERELLVTKEKAVAIADERTNFLASMSHEIRTPLNSIVGFTDLLGRTKLNDDQRDMLDAAKVSAKVLLSMVNDILDIGKLESGRFKLRENPFNPNEVIDYVVYTIDLQARAKNLPVEIESHIDDDLEFIGDDLILRQIMLNLLSNAVKFTNDGHVRVIVNMKKEKGGIARLMVDVEDTGAGVKEDKMDQLFEKYYSSDTEKQVGGTGLGLYICRLMVELQKGKIYCKSAHGKGSTFSIEIPYTMSPSAGRPVDPSQNGVDKSLTNDNKKHSSIIKNKKFLVVDDNPLNVKLMGLLIQKWDGRMQGAEDGEDALDKLNSETFDLVLTDLMMPKMDGFQLAKKLKSFSDQRSDIPIIALTADIMIENISDPKYALFETVVTKPINEEELYFKLIAILSQKAIT